MKISRVGWGVGVVVVFHMQWCVASPGPCVHCTPIFHIQGATERSAYAGKEVTTRGIVTFWAADHKLYWVQDPLGDGEPSTSDAISVVYRAAQGVRPEIGDWIELTGLVEDYETANGIPVTRLTPMRDVIVHANAQSLPTPIEITQVPTQSIVAARSFWLALEGMRVVLHNAAVVGPTDAAGEFVVLNTDKSSPHAPPGHALVNPLGPNEVDYHAERVVIAAKPLQLTPFKTGDTLAQVVGIVDYRRSQYKILAQDVTVGVLAPAPQPAIRNLAGNFAVVTMNVENLFDLEDDPNKTDEGDTPTPRQLEIKLRKLSSMIVETLNVPALLILQEVENQTILQVLGDRVNAMAGTRYVATSFDSSDARGIETGLLWDANQIQGMRAQSVTQSLYMELTGDASNVLGREPILAWLKFGDRDIAVLGVHLKSKRGDDPLFGARQPPLRNSEDLRKLQARALRNVIDHVAASIPEALWVVAGDFNDFSFGEPGEGEDHPLAIVRAEHTRFPLLETTDWVRREDRYTYIHEGNAQQLDHLLISAPLKERVAAINIIHANADFPAAWAHNEHIPWRVSDHDIIEMRLQVPGIAPASTAKRGAISYWLLLLIGCWRLFFMRLRRAVCFS